MSALNAREVAEAEAYVLARECGHDLNEALTVAQRRADDAYSAWERWPDGQSAVRVAADNAVVRAIEAMIRGES